jgi:hypothetical protein
MNKRQMRRLAETDPGALRTYIQGARQRELTARRLLLHPEMGSKASEEDLAALQEYIRERRWRSLYHHDRRMYRLLRAGAEKTEDSSKLAHS